MLFLGGKRERKIKGKSKVNKIRRFALAGFAPAFGRAERPSARLLWRGWKPRPFKTSQQRPLSVSSKLRPFKKRLSALPERVPFPERVNFVAGGNEALNLYVPPFAKGAMDDTRAFEVVRRISACKGNFP